MEKPDHNLSSPDRPSDLSPAKPQIFDLSAGLMIESNASSDMGEPAPNSSKEHDPANQSGVITKPEVHYELGPGVGIFPHLQKALTSEEVEVLSRHQSTGSRILEELAQTLSSNTKRIETARISSINALKERAKKPRTVLGVVGGTGHGKSSLINVLLEEDKLVPTNCFRACTAVVTEMSWNSADNPDHQYIAEVEFVSAEDWRRELGYLFHDLVTSSGEVSSEVQLEESDASIAWAKIKAIYPQLSRQTIRKTNPKKLAHDPAVKSLLGTTKTVRTQTAKELYQAIQVYVDSKEKKKGITSAGEENDSTRKMELWPLIKVVRIYAKADVLSTGAVIVDLPGVKDSNAARAAVAGKYIEKCDGLWVVSMITRAVDDQAAQELLGARFKQQLQLDGSYSNITFVCSKTDDIDIREAAESLGPIHEVQKLDDAKHRLFALETSSEHEKLSKRKDAVAEFAEQVDKHIDRYEKLRSLQTKGKTVNSPKEYPRKRKARAQIARSNKRQKVNLDQGSQDTQWVSTEDRWGDLEKNMPKFSAENPLTQEDIQLMTEYLRSEKQSAIDEKESLQKKIDDESDRLECLRAEVEELEEQLNVACVSRRNDCSRGAIRDQFALGLKELDEHEAQRTDPGNFNPENELRDYAQVGRSLPVFCISSRAYKSLTNGERVDGFSDIHDTEIPQLRAHAKKLTEATRIRHAKSFLNDLAQTLNSLYLWSSKKDIEIHLNDEEKKAEMGYVRERVDELVKRLQLANEELSRRLSEILETLSKSCKAAATHAAKCAPDIAHNWPSRKRGDGGLTCATYQAIIRRNGVYAGGKGPHNFNEDLAVPLLQKLGNNWETTFTKRISEALNEHAKTCQEHQEYIHGLIESRLRHRIAFNGIIDMLRDQDAKRVVGLNNKVNSFNSDVKKLQREANREFTPAIQQKLKSKYHECSQDKGTGVFVRIRLAMETEIEKRRRSIFKAACKSVETKLSKLPATIKEELQSYIDIMRDGMISDYSNAILGADSPEESKVIRQRVYELLEGVDDRFL